MLPLLADSRKSFQQTAAPFQGQVAEGSSTVHSVKNATLAGILCVSEGRVTQQ